MDTELSGKLEEFRKTVASTAEDITFRVFPNKILELQLLLESTSKVDSPYHQSHTLTMTDTTVYPPPSEYSSDVNNSITKKRKRTEGNVSIDENIKQNDTQYAKIPNLMLTNSHMVKIFADIQCECEQLADLCDKVKLWVNLTMPKIEDGDNFGVQIQEEVLSELHRAQESGHNLRDGARQHYLSRAKICSKIMKYPHLEDYALALKEHDAKQLYLARQHIIDIRNVYAVLTDVIHKNIVKIRVPKSNNGVGLY